MKPEEKEKLKKARKWLLKIYKDHDVDEFRLFIREFREGRPNLAKFQDASNFTLSELLYEQKSKAPYLGALWQEARNHKRMKSIWKGVSRKDYPPAIRRAIGKDRMLPTCNFCAHLHQAHPISGKACVDMGGVPGDVCCPGFQALSKKARKRA